MKHKRLSRRLSESLLILLLWSLSSFAEQASVPKPDFDIFLEKLGGTIPFPPQEMVKRLISNNKLPMVAAIFPHGRSLERDSTDYEHPRSLFMWQQMDGSDEAALVFVGYTPKKEQLEIISFNRASNQYEFRVVAGYGPGKKTEIITPNVGTCKACHQGGVPIFPGIRWMESSNDLAFLKPTEHKRIMKLLNKDPFAKFLLQHGPSELDRPAMSQTPALTTQASSFDFRLRMANRWATSRVFCKSICKPDDEACKRDAVTAFVFSRRADAEKYFSTHDIVSNFLKPEADTVLPLIDPQVQYRLYSDELVNRVSLGHEHEITEAEDPLMRRPVSEIKGTVAGIRRCFEKTPEDEVLSASGYPYSETLDLMKSPEISSLLRDEWPPSAHRISESLKSAHDANLRAGKVRILFDCAREREASQVIEEKSKSNMTQVMDRVSIQSETAQPPLPPSQSFIRYCASCHYGQGSIAPTLPLLDLRKLASYKGTAHRTTKKLLEQNLMPPEGADQPSDEERAALIQSLQKAAQSSR